MPNVFGVDASTVEEIVAAFRKHGDSVRDTYRVRYVFDGSSQDPYAGASLERPAVLRGNAPNQLFPWEQVFMAAANCAGSDYPMLAQHLGVPLDRVEFVVEGLFDPRGEFDGLGGFHAPPDSKPGFLALHLSAKLTSTAPREALERIHERVIERNMVLGALRGIPMTHELTVAAQRAQGAGLASR